MGRRCWLRRPGHTCWHRKTRWPFPKRRDSQGSSVRRRSRVEEPTIERTSGTASRNPRNLRFRGVWECIIESSSSNSCVTANQPRQCDGQRQSSGDGSVRVGSSVLLQLTYTSCDRGSRGSSIPRDLREQPTVFGHGQCDIGLGPESVIGECRSRSTIQESLHLRPIRILHVLRTQTQKRRADVNGRTIAGDPSPTRRNEDRVSEAAVVVASFRRRHSLWHPGTWPTSDRSVPWPGSWTECFPI